MSKKVNKSEYLKQKEERAEQPKPEPDKFEWGEIVLYEGTLEMRVIKVRNDDGMGVITYDLESVDDGNIALDVYENQIEKLQEVKEVKPDNEPEYVHYFKKGDEVALKRAPRNKLVIQNVYAHDFPVTYDVGDKEGIELIAGNVPESDLQEYVLVLKHKGTNEPDGYAHRFIKGDKVLYEGLPSIIKKVHNQESPVRYDLYSKDQSFSWEGVKETDLKPYNPGGNSEDTGGYTHRFAPGDKVVCRGSVMIVSTVENRTSPVQYTLIPFEGSELGVVVDEHELKEVKSFRGMLDKPPVGLLNRETYENMKDAERYRAIILALARYDKAEKLPPSEWIDELKEIYWRLYNYAEERHGTKR